MEVISEESDKFLNEEIKTNRTCICGMCRNFWSRYRLSRKAEKKALVVANCKAVGKLDPISVHAPPPEIESSSSKDRMAFESRQDTMKEIRDALKDDSTNMIGIYGMGGVGKTTLVEEIRNRAKSTELFDKILMATIS